MTDLPRTADVVVIGGGIVGCAAAYHLATEGAGHVALLEREDAVGRGSTGACAGGFRHQFTTEVNVRLSQASVPMILGFEEAHGIPVAVDRDGYLFLVRDETTWAGFRRAVDDQRGWGVEVEVIDADAVRELVPGVAVDDLVGATFGPRDGIADPGALTQGYATIAREAGATVVTDATVTAIEPAGDVTIDVHTPDGVVHAGAVVLAAGAWSAPLGATAGLEVPIAPVPRTILTTGPFPGVPDRRTLVIDMPSTFYLHREADGVLFGMGGADVETFDTSVDEAYVADHLLPRALEVFPPLAAAGIRSRWAGLYEMTPDRHPIVGATSVDGLWIAAGFSGHGFQHGPIVGKLLAEMIVGGGATTVDVRALSFDRFARGDLVREGHVV